MLAIYRREMGAFFTSGIAYVFLTVFWLVSGIFFYNTVIAAKTSTAGHIISILNSRAHHHVLLPVSL